MRAKAETFVCTESGYQITRLTEIEKNEPCVEYHGQVGIMGYPVPFMIDAENLNDAFNKFVASANKAAEEYTKHMQEANSLVDPSGKAIGATDVKKDKGVIQFPGK